MSARGKTRKMSVTLPNELAGEIKSLVSQGEVSSFFTEALEHYIAFRRQKAALEKGFGVWKEADHPDLTTPKDTRTYIRTIRREEKERIVQSGGRRAN